LVLAAIASGELGDTARGTVFLEQAAADHLQGFWALRALRLAGTLPPSTQRRWSQELHTSLAASPPRPGDTVRTWAALTTGPLERRALQRAAATALGLRGTGAMSWGGAVARQLWENGLPTQASRWNPRGFPRTSAFEAAWSAHQFLLANDPSWAIRLADAALQRLATRLPADTLPISLQRSLFPLPFPGPVLEAAVRHGVDWPLLAAVAREESRWNPSALSAVGARGLTQMMPRTAAETAARLGLEPPTPEDLFRPTVSLRLGAAELSRLLQDLDGNAAAATAAYNAGEPQTRLWLRFAGPKSDPSWFVAAIGFTATRSYTEDVLWAQHAYRTIWKSVVPETGR
ncbi:MAG TPA: hypothetical protein ENK19_09055, partial [Acidobacteria bacterium]|nr:hypothetical protein [Acidobacteriota bacterium]